MIASPPSRTRIIASKAVYLHTERHSHHRRRGSSYVFFLGTAMLVTIIGLSALMVVRVQRRSAQGSDDLAAARFYAQSAIEYGFTKINEEPDWRNILSTGSWATKETIGAGTFSLEISVVGRMDSTIKADDSVILVGTGVSGQATHKLQVTLIPQGSGVVLSPGSWKRSVN